MRQSRRENPPQSPFFKGGSAPAQGDFWAGEGSSKIEMQIETLPPHLISCGSMMSLIRYLISMKTQEKKGSIDRGNEQYLPMREATRLVEECSQKRIAVIGIDFARIREGRIYPQIPINSADWSVFLRAARWQDAVAQCNAASLRVLEREEREDPEQLCSFVFSTEEEWTGGDHSQPGRLSSQRKAKSMNPLSDDLLKIAERLEAMKAKDDFPLSTRFFLILRRKQVRLVRRGVDHG